ncbi:MULTISPECIES: NADH:flavin oxidoreductase/NADH oxidase family protein [Pseudomonas]|uniref:NADH:flavin oxidoreductase/NADH oxidase family protein n=1 Tax=Pseudomonas donghuensis TaxID=1163398 RepID=A0AAP0XDI9_9PSED|nr:MULTISPECIES: NADH:flavin oxidoreductase/NADH oxidase family protein [Pseudomonas]MDF9893043.1 2,4-dienoyl-CoA reductase-like NADH-dependent reductase (Old Yellow Enzyme family) [Pseudomonas vranovensis]KDN98741.1 NADH:flavin oxidoreductase/NADH oxidase family protein [Pseudomonas donghuensis]MBS7600691.1 NADH:flavin oxidoreductase/NADH oxidase family protein [Pseudomonas sp. RC2C2]MCP6690981.1 NADH:flavin oxidoreductase/NADH oxidase family protein [Pseudomonas donghuensis]MCP6696223.1 NADH
MNVFDKLTLPNASEIPNRLAKAAMEENMADADQAPSVELLRLYQAWAEGGAGLLISGNVMVDSRAMTGPGGVVLEDDRQLAKFKRWASVGRAQGAQFWLQINHPGRQMPANLGQPTWAPSAVALEMGKLSKHFNPPQAMTEAVIDDVIQRFARTAQLAEQAGFTGVEIHAAHGYLLSQFLSPLSNKRNDAWGGSLENRARLLLEIVKAVRAVVAPQFAVAVKLNSADFQRGGFSADDARQVVQLLNGLGVDLVELSGGSYEAPAMQGEARDGRTLAREAYFLEFARDVQKVASMPLMVTGGIRRLPVAQQVVDSGVAMVGIGTALAIDPNLPRAWQQGKGTAPALAPITWKNKPLASLANMALVKFQLRKLSQGKAPRPQVSPLWALIGQQLGNALRARQYRQWVAQRVR